MMLKLRIWLVVMLLSKISLAQNSDQINSYIEHYKFLAIAEMQRSGVPASIILAQGIHETSAGTSELVLASNNHFGIKCKSSWKGQVVYHDDDAQGECFRSYVAAADSYRDHSDYLTQTPRYAFLFKYNPEDYESWAYGLKKAGYATNVKYSLILIKLIRDYDLQKYSLIAMGKLPAEQTADQILADAMHRESLQGFVDSAIQTAPPAASFPEGTFTINAAKCIYAKAGVSLLSVSNQYDIPLSRLLEFNDMKQEDILAGDQLIFLQRKRKTGDTSIHIVLGGESMYTICQQEGIRYESLLELNRLRPGEEPATGEKIYLQIPASSKPSLRIGSSVKNIIPSS